MKYLVICVNEGLDVCSVDPFNTEQEANDFIAADAANVYDEIADNETSSIEVSSGSAKVIDDECIYQWSVYPLIIE